MVVMMEVGVVLTMVFILLGCVALTRPGAIMIKLCKKDNVNSFLLGKK